MSTFGRGILFTCFRSQIATESERCFFWIELFSCALGQFSRCRDQNGFWRAKLPGNPRECTWPATTIVLKGRVDAMASTGRKPYRLQRQTATWNGTRLQTYCWPVYAISIVVWLLVTNTKTERPFLKEASKFTRSPS